MKKLLVTATVLLICLLASAQNNDYIQGIRILYSDGTQTHLLCSANGICVLNENNAAAPVVQMNLGFSSRRAAVLKVQQ